MGGKISVQGTEASRICGMRGTNRAPRPETYGG